MSNIKEEQMSLFPHKKWWQDKNAPERYALMGKHNVLGVTDKSIRNMYLKETQNL